MRSSFFKYSIISGMTMGLLACSGGTSGNGTTSSSTGATGAFSIPDLNCGSAPCLTASSKIMAGTQMNSGEELASYGELVYRKFNSEVVPEVNKKLKQIEQVFIGLGYTTCAQIAGIAEASGEDLGDGYSVDITDISGQSVTSPFSGTVSKRFLVNYSSTPVLDFMIGCDGNIRNVHVKVIDNASNRYEIWAKSNSANQNEKSLELAADTSDGAKTTLRFTSTSATAFTLGAIGKSYPNPYGGSAIDFSIYGEAILGSPTIAKIVYSNVASSAPAFTWAAVNTNWDLSPIAHCYSNLDQVVVDSDGSSCSSLSTTPPTSTGVRGSGGASGANSRSSTWSIDDFTTGIGDISHCLIGLFC